MTYSSSMLLNKVERYCSELLVKGNCPHYPFHNIGHTKEVVANIDMLITERSISDIEVELVKIAAWFHDTGYSKVYIGHEDESKGLARSFLEGQGHDGQKIKTILDCIDATKISRAPVTYLEKVLCDADLFHLGTNDFVHRNPLLRKEWEQELGRYYSTDEWDKLNLGFLEGTTFYTGYGKSILEKGRLRNMAFLSEKIKKGP